MDPTAQGRPDTVDGFTVVARLGEGATATVYQVVDAHGAPYALKLMTGLHQADHQELLRFEREVQIAASLDHPNVVHVFRANIVASPPYALMELVDGPSLRSLIAERPAGPLDEAWRHTVLDLGTPLFVALQHVHNRRIIHRDIKPENVIVAGPQRPVLVDFGLAESQSQETQDREGTISGTFAYLGPELLQGRDAERRSDIFSLGVLLLEFISGRLPYPQSDVGTILQVLATAQPMRLRDLVQDAPEPLDELLARMTARNPEDRPLTVADAYYQWLEATRTWGERSSLAAMEASTYDLVLPALAGRDDLLQALSDLRNQVVWLEGVEGCGRTRLLDHWTRRLPADVSLLRTRAVPQHNVPYGPLLEELRCMLLAHPNPDSLHRLRRLLDPSSPVTLTSNMEHVPGAEKLSLHEEIRTLLAAQPLVLVIDDFHYADPETRDLVSYLADRPAGITVVLSVLQGSAGPPPPRATRLECGPLDAPAVAAMTSSALGVLTDAVLPPPVLSRLSIDTGNWPGAIVETLNAWLLEGVLRQERDCWVWHEDAYVQLCVQQAGQSEDHIYRAVRRLLDEPTPGARALLTACVVGQEGFSFDEVVRVSEQDKRDAFLEMERLVSIGILSAERQGGLWRYAFVRQRVCKRLGEEIAATEQVAAQRRWVRVLAETIQHQEAPALEDIFRLVAWCDDRIDWSDVAPVLDRAAATALQMMGYSLAFDIYRKLLAKAPPERRHELTRWAADSGNLAGQYSAVLPLLETALRSASAAERPALLALMARTLYEKGEFARAMSMWTQTLDGLGVAVPGPTLRGAVAAQVSFLRAVVGLVDRRLIQPPEAIQPRLEACYGLIHANYFLADPKSVHAVVSIVATVIQIAKATQRADLLAWANFLFGYFYTLLKHPRWASIVRHLETSHQCAERYGQNSVRIPVLRDIGYVATQAGEPYRGRDWTQQGLQLARTVRDISGQAWHLQVGAYVRRWTGDLKTAAEDLEEATVLVESLQHGRLGVATRQELAHILTWRGQFAEADALFEQKRPFEVSTPFDDIQGLIYRGWLRLRQGRAAEAGALLDQAFVRLQSQHNGTLWEMQAMLGWGLALSDQARAQGWQPEPRLVLSRLVRRNRRRGKVPPLMRVLALPLEAEEEEHRGRPAAALQRLETAIALCRTHKFRVDVAWCLQRRALLVRRQGLSFQSAWEEAAGAWEACGAEAQATRWRAAAAMSALPLEL